MAIAVLISQGIVGAACLLSLTKDHLTKDGELICQPPYYSILPIQSLTQRHATVSLAYQDVAINTVTTVFRVYLADQSMDHLSSNLKKGGVKDLLAFLPANKRSAKNLDAHFRGAGLPQVADWFAKRQAALAKEAMLRELHERLEADEPNEDVRLSFSHQYETVHEVL